jgi:hypothetical protein
MNPSIDHDPGGSGWGLNAVAWGAAASNTATAPSDPQNVIEFMAFLQYPRF